MTSNGRPKSSQKSNAHAVVISQTGTALCNAVLFPLALQTIEFDEGAGAVLRIQPLRAPRDENIYECVAENTEGEINVNAKLSIIRGESSTAAANDDVT